MRVVLVCGFLIVGLPNLLGLALGACLRLFLLLTLRYSNLKVLAALADVASGFATAIAAVLIGGAISLGLARWLPIVATVWFAIHFTLLHRPPQLVRCGIGVLCGWWAYSAFLN
jgi:hypothetical protein